MITCPRCGTSNPATARFCTICGTPLVSAPSGQSGAPSMTPSIPAAPVPSPYYQYAPGYIDLPRATAIDRTKTGLLIMVIGFLISWIPFVGGVGGLLELVGAIMVILGRHAFGSQHARNVIWSIIIVVIAIVVAVVAVFVAVFSALANFQPGGSNGRLPPNFTSFLGTFLVAILIGIVIFGIAEVLFTYALQTTNGRILLWCGYASSIAVASIGILLLGISPYFSGVLQLVPAIFYGYAYYLARERIVRGEIPTPVVPAPIQ